MADTDDTIEWVDLPPSGKERVKRMLPQATARIGRWGRMPADISAAMVRSAALEVGVALDISVRKVDGATRVWIRLREPEN